MKVFNASLFVLMFGLLMYVTSCSQQQIEDESAPGVDTGEISVAARKTRAVEAKRVRMDSKAVAERLMMPAPSMQSFSNYQNVQMPQDSENYLSFQENHVMSVAEQSVSTFSIDVDTAAYSNIRRMLVREGRMPPADAVKLEEMINYFNYQYEKPASVEQPFSVQVEMATAPWNKNRQLLQIGLKGFEPALDKRPAANLVFLVDVSGSMHSADKLGLVKRALQMLVNQMNEQDRIALVVYAGAAGEVLASTSGDQKSKIMRAIESLDAGGSTNGGAGLELAYQIAEENRIEGGINRVLIASDGDMNVGITDLSDLKALIKQRRQSGIALTTLGFGSGNYNYALMEQLADVGDGNAVYIDSLLEAKKVLVEEMQGTLLTIAKDVKIQIEFNPNVVAEYRLLGYENRLLAREDFTNDKVDAGDIGAGHTVTALYEIALVDNTDLRLSPKTVWGFWSKTASYRRCFRR